MTTILKAALTYSLLLSVTLVGAPAQAIEPLVLYDDFNTVPIDPEKWFGAQFTSGGARILESILTTMRGRLRLENRTYGRTDADTGAGFGGFRLAFANSALITAIEATVQVYTVEATGCPTPGSDVTRAGIRLAGRFFNTGIPTPGSAVNDVFAIIEISRHSDSPDPPKVLQVRSVVVRCTNPDCTTSVLLNADDLGTVKIGENVRLGLQWDPGNNQFIFRLNGAEFFSPYSVPDTASPGLPFQRIEVANFVANCTALPRPVGFVRAFFDGVFVNESALLADE